MFQDNRYKRKNGFDTNDMKLVKKKKKIHNIVHELKRSNLWIISFLCH